MRFIHSRAVKKAASWLVGVTSETAVILAGASVIAGLWYLGFVLKAF